MQEVESAGAVAGARAPLQVRSGYFWFYAAIGAFSPFVSLYYRDLGMSGLQLGILMALPAMWTALTGAVWGAIADSLAIHRTLLRVVLVTAAGIGLLATQPTTFVALLVLMSMLAFSLVPVPPLLDSYAVNVAERTETSYGSLRVWGSIGYTVMVLVMGEVLGETIESRFLVYYAGCLLLAWLSVFWLPSLAERRARPLLDGLSGVRGNRPFLLLLLVAYLLSSGIAVINNFLGIHIQEIGGTTGEVGIAYAVSAMSEFPVLFFSGWLLRKIGARRIVVVAMVAYILRFAILGFADGPALVIVAQLFHGLSFGGFLIASVTLAYRLVGRENAATGQAVLGMMSFGFGSITGSLVAGALLDAAGTYSIFRGITLLMVATLAIFVVGSRVTSLDGNGPAQAS